MLISTSFLFAIQEPSVGTWIILTGSAVNISCALLGSYLILRKMSMMGDALSHAVLPGLVVAFAVSGSMGIVPMFIGAIVVGLLTTFLTQTLHQYARVPSDASMGIVFTAMFALGVVLIKFYAGGLHFDMACVYEGALEYVSFADRVFYLPRPLFSSLVVLIINLLVITLLWKELKLTSFDPALATTMGISATFMHYLLMTLVSVTTVASFEAVGSILVVAMLIVPASTAHLLTDRLGPMVLLAAVIGVLAAVLGYNAAIYFDTNISGMMTVAAGCLYALAVLISPKYGVISRLLRNLQMSLRVFREDLLAMLYRVEELGSTKPLSLSEAQTAVGGTFLARIAANQLLRHGEIVDGHSQLKLTDKGRESAKQLVRSHRLWEAYLVKHLGLPLDHVHDPAHRVEHFIGEGTQKRIAAELDLSAQDPHGREIPD
jgi:manganese/zinc/iron transport system permease protein